MLKLALVGAGYWGSTHAQSLARLGYCLSAVVDVDPSAAERVARRYGCSGCRIYGNVEALSGVDAAIVAVPPEHLYPIAKRLIERDINVLVEKPVATRSLEAEELAKLAEERRVVAAAGYLLRFHPVSRILRELAESQGRCLIELHRLVPARRDWPVSIDLAVHDVDLALWAFGELERLYYREKRDEAILVMSGGRTTILVHAARAAYKLRVLRAYCEDEVVEFDQDSLTLVKHPEGVSTKLSLDRDPLSLEQETFIKSVEKGELIKPLASLWDAARVLRMLGR